MRSFTKKNTKYTIDLYKLLYTNDVGDNFKKFREKLDNTELKNASKALISLFVQWENKYNPKAGLPLNIESFINKAEIKDIFTKLANEDYVKNMDGTDPKDIISEPQTNASFDLKVIAGEVKFADINLDYIGSRKFNPDEIVKLLTSDVYRLHEGTNKISTIVLKNACTLIILKQVLDAVKKRSGYDNLYGFIYDDSAGTTQIKLDHYVYLSVAPDKARLNELLDEVKNKSKNIGINSASAKSKSNILPLVAEAVELITMLYEKFIEGNVNSKNIETEIKIPKSSLRKLSKINESGQIGASEIKAAYSEFTKRMSSDESSLAKKINWCLPYYFGVLSGAVGAVEEIIVNPGIASDRAALDELKSALKKLGGLFNRKVINSYKLNVNPGLSVFSPVNGVTNIVEGANPVIKTGTKNIKFSSGINEVTWRRQGMEAIEAAGYCIIPFDEGEGLIKKYALATDAVRKQHDSEARQGKLLYDYMVLHCKEEGGYRYAKQNLILLQGFYCAFCESQFSDGRIIDIEHKLPKSVFPSQALQWMNFVLCCKVCNSDFKNQQYIDGNKVVTPGKLKYPDLFDSKKGKDYLKCKEGSEQEVLWPDKRHVNRSTKAAHNLLSFQSIMSKEPALKLHEIDINTSAHITAVKGSNSKYQIEYKRPDKVLAKNVMVELLCATGLPGDEGNVGIGASTKNIINICGLDKTGMSYWNDQRIANRTKAWLNAMKQLRILSEFNVGKFDLLYNYYKEQLHPVNIKNAVKETNIGSLKIEGVHAQNPVTMDTRIATIKIVKKYENGVVEIDLSTENIAINGATINQGILSGKITGTTGMQTMTGKIISKPEIPTLTNVKILLFKDASISSDATHNTIINIAPNQGVTFGDDTMLGEWDNNRADLLQVIEQAAIMLKDFVWENIIDMVRLGGFYSTWVQAFKNNRPIREGKQIPYDIELVKRLEEKALENPVDPFQFHGTDAEEIIACL